jgi:hypothetical protein
VPVADIPKVKTFAMMTIVSHPDAAFMAAALQNHARPSPHRD